MNTENILILFELYSKSTGLKESTIATYATSAGGFIKRLRGGCDITTNRYNRVIQWFSDHWPDDLPWPDDIPRPEPTARSQAKRACPT